ncbi:MAG: polyprenyl synthetase family protein [Candidatus Methanomethylicia archaeon]
MNIERVLEAFQHEFNDYLNTIFPEFLYPNELYSASKHLLKSGGKRLRPFLTFQSCKIIGGNTNAIMPAAAAIELIHNFTLIHDDIMDKDEFRRGVPTVHKLWGIPMAILAGDVLFSKAFEILFECTKFKIISFDRIIDAAKKLANAVTTIAEGQTMDMSFEGKLFHKSISESDYLNMICKKTAVLIKTACELGGILGMGEPEAINALSSYGENIGMAFQIRDDILGIVSDEKILGKPVGSDLRDGKCTLVLLHAAINCNNKQKQTLMKYYGKKDLKINELNEVINVLNELGSFEYASSIAKRYVSSAKNALNSLPNTEDKTVLIELADYILHRGY